MQTKDEVAPMFDSFHLDSLPESNSKGGEKSAQISDKTVARVRWYLYVLDEFERKGVSTVSSQAIADKLGVTSGLVRKDLCHFGGFGRPSIGYNVGYLKKQIKEILHINETMRIVWVGAKRLVDDPGTLRKFADNNCKLAAVFDADPDAFQTLVAGFPVMGTTRMGEAVRDLEVDAGVVAVSESQAQRVADELVSGGIRAILNLTSTVLTVPQGVTVRNVDIAGELMMLSYYRGENP